MVKKIIPASNNETMGYRLKVIRNSLGMNQEEFAKLFNTHQEKISSIERNLTAPTLAIIQKISSMGYDMNWFLNGVQQDTNLADYVSNNIEIMRIVAALENMDNKQIKFISNFVEMYIESLEGGKNNE
ncbi:MAG TPA: helix-turn-helix transcriptional regulator [Candidatus Fusicatenibacter intestinipullorum]|nr:helix-turn-helix transcriptional regulator [Candidatus Fusicatenibacter intestinipullorum]